MTRLLRNLPLLAVVIVTLIAVVSTGLAQDHEPTHETTANHSDTSHTIDDSHAIDASHADIDDSDTLRKRNTVTIGFLLLSGIAAVGVLLLGIVIGWGMGVRRVAKAPLPASGPPPDDWYLKRGPDQPPGETFDTNPPTEERTP